MGEGGLSAQERLMLMTMIDINNGDTLYEQARHNMMKIMTGAKEDDNLRFFKAFICIFSISLPVKYTCFSKVPFVGTLNLYLVMPNAMQKTKN